MDWIIHHDFLSASREAQANAAPAYMCCLAQQNCSSTAALQCWHFETVCQGAVGPLEAGISSASPGWAVQGNV